MIVTAWILVAHAHLRMGNKSEVVGFADSDTARALHVLQYEATTSAEMLSSKKKVVDKSTFSCSQPDANYDRELEAQREKPAPSKKGVIVILAGLRNEHDELGRTLENLYKFYNDKQRDDVMIAHTGEFDKKEQNSIRSDYPEVFFFKLEGENWEVYPKEVKASDPNDWESVSPTDRYVGYRKMIRWYSVRIWPVLAQMNYTWVARLDDDSALLSDIQYNLFGFMEHYGLDYAYRVWQHDRVDPEWYKFLSEYARAKKIPEGRLQDECVKKNGLANHAALDQQCQNSFYSYYNNFFVARIGRFMEADAQQLLRSFDESGNIFTNRWGDAIIHTAVVEFLFKPSAVFQFTGWSYSHLILQIGRDCPTSRKSHIWLSQSERDCVTEIADQYNRLFRNVLDRSKIKEYGGMLTVNDAYPRSC